MRLLRSAFPLLLGSVVVVLPCNSADGQTIIGRLLDGDAMQPVPHQGRHGRVLVSDSSP